MVKKNDFKQIIISDINIEQPDLKSLYEPKSVAIAKWLISYIKTSIKNKTVEYNSILPSKADFAYKLGVSVGTMQNAFRYVEDLGFVESKQCIGTVIKDNNSEKNTFRKLTTKRDLAVESIKRYISSNGFKVGYKLPSSRTIATIIGHCSNTTRMALELLSIQGIIAHRYKNAKDYGWIINNLDFELDNTLKTQTLSECVVKDLEFFIEKNLNVGDKIPSHMELAKRLNTSIKTVHDGLKVLADKGILLPKRGRYGTTVIKIPNRNDIQLKPEMSIFAPAKDTAFYHYEKTQNNIKRIIAQNYQIGDKLPSILEISKEMDLSPNTVRKALHNLSKEGYLVFSRGRYGGTFVIDIPEVENRAFKWLAVNPQYVNLLEKSTN